MTQTDNNNSKLLVKIRGLHFSHGPRVILGGVDIDIERGKITTGGSRRSIAICTRSPAGLLLCTATSTAAPTRSAGDTRTSCTPNVACRATRWIRR